MVTRITSTQLARNLSDILNRARYKGESFVIERNGEPIATVEPPPRQGITLEELTALIADLPPCDDKFAADLETARSILRDTETPQWPN